MAHGAPHGLSDRRPQISPTGFGLHRLFPEMNGLLGLAGLVACLPGELSLLGQGSRFRVKRGTESENNESGFHSRIPSRSFTSWGASMNWCARIPSALAART